ncbi:MAG: hypothetical protein H6641_12065 [Caldilineaceae bacterium]|nr:hypothetical protein [Caldilineaceae bacterium]
MAVPEPVGYGIAQLINWRALQAAGKQAAAIHTHKLNQWHLPAVVTPESVC